VANFSSGTIEEFRDVWGPDVRGRDQIIACLTALRDDPAALAQRAGAGLAALASLPETGPALAAVGFCFGGMAVLTLARMGEPLRGVVSVHGNLTTTAPATPGAVRARVLVCHGSRDPHVPPADVAAFAEEMDQASADWELVMFGGAEHGFTHATASPGATPGVAYDPRADHRSFAIIRQFLAEVTPV
jgi:dienelactone hydrolase